MPRDDLLDLITPGAHAQRLSANANMDELTESYGQLSTTAKEWTPLRQSISASSSMSSYNATTTPISPVPPISPRPASSSLRHSLPGRTGVFEASPRGGNTRWLQAQDGNELTGTGTGGEFIPGKSWKNAPMAPLQQSQGADFIPGKSWKNAPLSPLQQSQGAAFVPGESWNNAPISPSQLSQGAEFIPGRAWKNAPISPPQQHQGAEFIPGDSWKNAPKSPPQQSQGAEYIPGEAWKNATIQQSQGSWGQRLDVHASTEGGNQESFGFENEEEPVVTSVPTGPVPLPSIRSLHTMGLPDDLWLYRKEISLEAQREMDPSDPRHKAVPLPFTSAYQLDGPNEGRDSFGYPSSVFKVVNREDGHLYCIRRFDNTRVSFKIARAVSERWTTAISLSGATVVEHTGIVRFHSCFLANRALFFVYTYYPGARTLFERFFNTNSGGGIPLPEPFVWSCITQLVSAIRTVHTAKLACRSIQLNHILCTSPDGGMGQIRLRINCIGVVDTLEFETRKSLVGLQYHDMRDLGYVIMSLTTGTALSRVTDPVIMQGCDRYIAQNYSRELYSLVMQLLNPASNPPTILEVCRSIAIHAFDEVDSTFVVADTYESALASEYESGRALRLLLKMGFINERPEFLMNRRWTESGDCYVLKLFRDYVFHQADGSGHPVMDQGHVVTALNKLDAGDEEKMVLSSTDGRTLLVVSFADVARCLERAYSDLCSMSILPSTLQY